MLIWGKFSKIKILYLIHYFKNGLNGLDRLKILDKLNLII